MRLNQGSTNSTVLIKGTSWIIFSMNENQRNHFQWESLKIHFNENPFPWKPTKIYENQGKWMKINENQFRWKLIKVNESQFRWNSIEMKTNESQWKSRQIDLSSNQFQWKPMKVNESQWKSIKIKNHNSFVNLWPEWNNSHQLQDYFLRNVSKLDRDSQQGYPGKAAWLLDRRLNKDPSLYSRTE